MDLKRLALILVTLLTFAFPAAARVNEMNPRGAPTAAETRTPPSRSLAAPQRAPHGSRADEQRYAERQKASKNAKKFRGGEPVVVITATAAIIILLGVIILLLIT